MVALVALAMLPTGALAIRAGLEAGAERASALTSGQDDRAQRGAQAALAQFSEAANIVRVLAVDGARLLMDPARCDARLAEISGSYGNVTIIVGADRNKRLVCSSPATEMRADLSQSPTLTRADERGRLAAAIVPNPVIGSGPTFGAGMVVTDDVGRRRGYFGLGIGVEAIFDAAAAASNGAIINAALLDRDGDFVMMTPLGPAADEIRQAIREQGPEAFATDDPILVQTHDQRMFVQSAADGDVVLIAAVAPVPASWRSRFGDFAAVATPLALWALAVAAAWLAMEMAVVRPLKALESMAQDRSEGRSSSADRFAETNPPVEIRRVRTAIDDMAVRLLARSEELQAALLEEKALLREVHHRVKNNLQTVASLLQIQARSASDDSEAWGLARAHDRVQLLALVHQRIYASGVVRDIRLDSLAADIARHLLSARGEGASNVNLKLDVRPARCDADKVAAMAFLIGEGLTRALDALMDAEPTELQLSLAQFEEGALTRLAIAVNGPIPMEASTSVELRFIDAFARQLKARVGTLPHHPALMWCEADNIASAPEEME